MNERIANEEMDYILISSQDDIDNDTDVSVVTIESPHSTPYRTLDFVDDQMDEPSDQLQSSLSKKSKIKSPVWKYFKYDEKKNQSVCHFCLNSYNGKCPSNLQKHLKAMHQEIFNEIQGNFAQKTSRKIIESNKFRQLSIDGHLMKMATNFSTQKYDSNSSKYLILRKKLSILFAANSIPYSIVETPEFAEFVNELDSKFVLPGRRTVSRDITKLTNDIKSATETAITEAKQVTAILDIWSKLALTESYLGIKLQFFNLKVGEMQRALLALEKLDGAHTADKIFATFCRVIERWNIPFSKINYFITDNGSNMVKALRNVIDEYQLDESDFVEAEIDELDLFLAGDRNIEQTLDEELINFEECENAHETLFGLQKRIGCMAHRLVCVLRRCVDNCTLINPIISAGLSLIRTFTKSIKNMEALMSNAANNRRIKLLSPSRTRWLNLYHVFQRLVELEQSVENVVVENNLIDVALSPLQWKQIKLIVSLLEPFAEAVIDLEGEKYATLSHVIPTLYHLIDHLDNEDGSAAIISIRRNIRSDLEKTFCYILDPDAENFQPIFTVATFFEPKFITGLSEHQIKAAITEIQRQIQKENNSSQFSLPPPLSSSDISVSPNVSCGKFSGFFKRRAPTSISASDSIISKSFDRQIQMYIDEANKLNFSTDRITEREQRAAKRN